MALPFGHNLPPESEFCLEGQQIPASALYLPTTGQQRSWGVGLFIDGAYRQVVTSATTKAVSYRFIVVTLHTADERSSIGEAVSEQLRDEALLNGVENPVSVSKLDTAGGIRSASEGIKLVYLIIAWGVLVLGGLGLLVAEMIIVRDRTWFFGLARALGATTRHIAILIFADVLLVLAVGTALAILLAAAMQPAASSFAASAFAVDAQLVRASAIPRLLAGSLLVLLIAGVFPAVKATRQDPIDVLEPKTS
jgi:ABC-type antimicrobial peptide transport system permease subunit